MMPFDLYPKKGRELLGELKKGGKTRFKRAPELMRETDLTKCAYCGLDFKASLIHWRQMTLDHVVPKGEKFTKGLGIPEKWTKDYTNRVLACYACNPSHSVPHELQEDFKGSVKACTACNGSPDSDCKECLKAFYTLRDCFFLVRKERCRKDREKEENFFNSRPWEKPI